MTVKKTISSPLLAHKIASSSSLMRIYVLFFSDAYLRPNSPLTHKHVQKSCTQKLTNFSPKSLVQHLFGAEIWVKVAKIWSYCKSFHSMGGIGTIL